MSEQDNKRKKTAFFDIQPSKKRARLQISDDQNNLAPAAFQKSKRKSNVEEQVNNEINEENNDNNEEIEGSDMDLNEDETNKRVKRVFPYGNYNRYYSGRYKENIKDPRINVIVANSGFEFEGKDILDVGCNVGLFTIQIAEHLKPKQIKGVDIDAGLIRKANKIKEEIKFSDLTLEESIDAIVTSTSNRQRKAKEFVLETNNKITDHDSTNNVSFPDNVTFERLNIVAEESVTEQEKYDVIFCLSITKWVHLNNGDDGIKLLFKKVFEMLRPGGLFILEPQDWKSYSHHKTLTKKITAIYQEIKFRPKDFKEHLLSVVGFDRTSVAFVEVENNEQNEDGKKRAKKGFDKRPVCFYYKK
ncbi:RNA methyltransferase [Acrasis kona]|uniref:RNA methyltransferase n=1 Tax=Acrasis kona TaxID=1008807 RepID=A0AAW2Z7P0_9EUKA